MSPFHVDAGGCLTMVVLVQGKKDWFWLKGVWEKVQQAFQIHGPTYTGYANGIAGTVLEEGCAL